MHPDLWLAYQRTLPQWATLDDEAKDVAAALLNAAWAEGIPLWIQSARRSEEEQRRLVEAGRSLTMRSKHLRGRAFDLDVIGYARRDVPLAFWEQVARWLDATFPGRVIWGGTFRTLRDFGHFELRD